MASTPGSSNDSPVNKVPYEILKEIFIHCLPQHPFAFDTAKPFNKIINPQPDVAVAPMLLCQICSSWRMVALTSATLWSHLSYRLKIVGVRSPGWMIPKSQFLFLSWWKKNQGSIPPFLCLDMSQWRSYRTLVGNNVNAKQDLVDIDLLCEYFTSAQYLQCDRMYWRVIEQWISTGHQAQVRHPNLHTLVAAEFHAFYHLQPLIFNPTHPTLRYLSIYGDQQPELFSGPIHYWSTLAHISLGEIICPLSAWFSVIRSLPHLHWAYISISELTDTLAYVKPAECTLPLLSTFFVRYYNSDEEFTELPLSLLFMNLHLPALRTLSLFSYHHSWPDCDFGVIELYNVLKSTPAVTTIILGVNFLCFGRTNISRESAALAARFKPRRKPIWSYAPQLTHLHLELPNIDFCMDADAEEQLESFVSDYFFDDDWLDLDNPACPIQTITLINTVASNWDFDLSCVRESPVDGPDITFEITLDSPIWLASQMWQEWGSRF